MPPVSAFWSLTLYDREEFQVAKRLNRFAVSRWMPFKYNSDGSSTFISRTRLLDRTRRSTGFRHPQGHSI
jgi:hypothetical protein